ncbi:hypothetical protein [Kitasatospora acidiphila]|uniref:hypothetical protein n=1 Tax=Kitasatospora acidiphila TaxID=2567942 RepID=UPI0015F104DE|nr:hypothetical protein [Kitasatospora acidiphila]
MGESAGRGAPWGSCPRCGRALVRDWLPLQAGPGLGIAMQGPPVCPGCTAEEVEAYLAVWEPPQDEPEDEDEGERDG